MTRAREDVREALIALLSAPGWNPRRAARVLGVPVRTAYDWRERAEAEASLLRRRASRMRESLAAARSA